jgi:hypothetical protein
MSNRNYKGFTPGPIEFDGSGGGGGSNFTPENTGTEGDVLTKTATGYAWQTPSPYYDPVPQSLTLNDRLSMTTEIVQGENSGGENSGGSGGGSPSEPIFYN